MNIEFTPARTINIAVFVLALLVLSDLSLGGISENIVRTFFTIVLSIGLYKRKNWARQILLFCNYLALFMCIFFIYNFVKDGLYSYALSFVLFSLFCALFINQFQFRDDLVALFYDDKGQEYS